MGSDPDRTPFSQTPFSRKSFKGLNICPFSDQEYHLAYPAVRRVASLAHAPFCETPPPFSLYQLMPDHYIPRCYSNDFNSHIDYQDLTLRIHDYVLTLKIRIFIKPMNPPPGQTTFVVGEDFDAHSAMAQRWQPAEFDAFRKEFKRQCYAAWNDAFVLIPPPKYTGFIDPNGTRRNVRTFLEIDLREEEGTGIHTIKAHRLTDGFQYLRAHSGRVSNHDISPSRSSIKAPGPITPNGTPGEEMTYYFQHNTFPHEVGHLLGLDHITEKSASCKKHGPNSKGCYGVFLTDAMNIMGQGNALSLANAKPWRERIARHAPGTQPQQWTVDFASSEARLRGLWSLTTQAS
jgi:hypothetical protein